MAEQNSRLVYSTGTGSDAVDRRQDVRKEPQQPQRQPEGRGVRLRLERRASDRLATLISGLPGSEQKLTALLKELKTACGAGGTVKDGILELQGDHRDKVEAVLRARGITSKRAGG
jgi:translation initiation factor 1